MAQHPELTYYTLTELESQLGTVKLEDFIQSCERRFLQEIFSIASKAAWRDDIKVIFISGPTSSGKTTTADRLAGALRLRGKNAVRMSLDDYYVPGKLPDIVDGRKDFESPETLDLEAIGRDINALISGERVQMPTFNFMTRSREIDPARNIKLGSDSILLVEGLHGLSPKVSGSIPREHWYGIMLRPWATLMSDHRLLSARDIRMMRRIARDVSHRNTPALATIDYWPMLDRTEEVFFPIYTERADVFINTAMAYEFYIIPQVACNAMRQDLERLKEGKLTPSPYVADGLFYADLDRAVAEAEHLIAATSDLPVVPIDQVPGISILNEFIR